MKTFVIILAGGKGTRMNASLNKVLMNVCGKSVIRRSTEAFSSFADEIVIVCRPEEQDTVFKEISLIGLSCPVRFAPGGDTRQASVLNGLKILSPDPQDSILIHDAARCLVSEDLIRSVLLSVAKCGTGIPGIPASSTYKICNQDSMVVQTPDRSSLYEIQTPQGFTAELIIPLSLRAHEEKVECTDDAGILEYYGVPVKVIQGPSANIKLTEPEDLSRAKLILEGDIPFMRIGMGYDVHRLVADKKLILCGVEIPFGLGLLGHSDADVALHALMDAMLGACALGDIGKYFPDTDDRYSGVSSMFLLRETVHILSEAGYSVYNADITIVAQNPKLLPYIPMMSENIASALDLKPDRISVKATTTEKLGFEGRMEGISAYAVCTVTEKNR